MATYGYIRVSKYRPEKDGLSPEIQTAAINEHCARESEVLTEIYSDEDRSGKAGKKREAWDELWERLQSGDKVIAFKMTRVGRNTIESLTRLELLSKRDVDVVTLDGKYDTRSSIGKVITGVLCLFAEFENDQRSEWIKASHNQIAKRGSWPGGRLPYGYRFDDDHAIQIDEEKASIVREIFDLTARGNGQTFVVKELLKRGIVSPKKNGRWQIRTVSVILRNHAYVGEREYQGKVYPADITPIVDRETWDRVRAIEVKLPTPSRPRYLLSGILSCSLCGGNMVHKPRVNGTAPQYECLSRKVWGDCKGVGITDHIAERAVLESLFAHIDSGGYSEAVDAYEFQEKQAPELRSLRSSLTKVDGKRVRLLHLYTEGRIEIAEYDAQVEPLNNQVKELESEIERAEAGVRLPPVWKGDIRKDWEVLTLDEQRHALRLFVEKIEVASGGRGPGRVGITWR